MSLHLPDIANFIAAHHYLAHWAVFLLALSEAIPIVGTVVPGSTLVVAISALATASEINAWLLVVDATLGAIIGDGLSFWLGRHYHREILQRWPLNLFPEFIARSEKFFNRYGAASVFLARFTAVVRAFVPSILTRSAPVPHSQLRSGQSYSTPSPPDVRTIQPSPDYDGYRAASPLTTGDCEY